MLALVFANGFFVAAEFAIVTVRKTRIDQLIAEGHRGARAVRRAVTDPDSYIAATQLGITMASLGLGWIGEPALASLIEPAFAFLPAPIADDHRAQHRRRHRVRHHHGAAHRARRAGAQDHRARARRKRRRCCVVKPTELFMRAFWPFIRLLNGTGRAVVSLLGLRSRGGHAMVHSEEELKMLVTASQEAGVLEEQEEQMLHRVFGFADLTAGQVMVPRTEIVAVDADAPRERAASSTSARGGYTRLPVYRKDLDNVIGILHVTDLVQGAGGRADATIDAGALAREALTVPETLARRRPAGRDAPRGRARSDRHRRVRRHGRARHVRVADGAHRRRPRRRAGGAARIVVPRRTARPTSTA